MDPLHIRTPLLRSGPLSGFSGTSIWLKMEALQPSGSFKIRGIGLACSERIRQGARSLVSSSGGNAGIAVAYSGDQLGVPVTVVVPATTTDTARERISSHGAEVIVEGSSWNEAHEHALALAGDGAAYIHPFDDPLIWRGHSTLIDEIADSGLEPDVIVASVGGAGLLCGILEGLHRNSWEHIPVIAVETQGADSLHQAVESGRLVELAAITSIATSLGSKRVCARALRWTSEHEIHSVVVTDASAVDSCLRFVTDHGVLVEPACGASLSTVYEPLDLLKENRDVLIVVCGGVGVTLEQLETWRDTL
jgi:L-serine/L-threonine ammonia-lyase